MVIAQTPLFGALGDDAPSQLGRRLLGHVYGTGLGDRDRGRVDAAGQVGPTGGRVVVGRVVQRFDGRPQGGLLVAVRRVDLLQCRLREQRTRTDRVVSGAFLVPAADDVVRDDAARMGLVVRVEVVADEQRDDRETLHRRPEVAPHHRRQAVGLAVEGQLNASIFS